MEREREARLSAAPFTYEAVGATPVPQQGYLNLTRSRRLERRDFEATAELLLTWRMHERSGFRVAASAPRAAEGVVVQLRLGVGPLALRFPCRVVHTIEETDRAGFAYGTLPGHPESGEELFLLERQPDGSIEFTVTAFSKPATALARAGGPISRAVQRIMTDRYLGSLDTA